MSVYRTAEKSLGCMATATRAVVIGCVLLSIRITSGADTAERGGCQANPCPASSSPRCVSTVASANLAPARVLLQQGSTNRRTGVSQSAETVIADHSRPKLAGSGTDVASASVTRHSAPDDSAANDWAWNYPDGEDPILQRGPAPAPSMGLLAAAPNPHIVKKKVAHEQKLASAAASGDLHFTTHGCHCLLNWTIGDMDVVGCSGHPDHDHSGGYPWCQVTEECEHGQGVTEAGVKWDWCNHEDSVAHIRTVHACHCSPAWDYKDTLYESCSRTSKGPKWCYVFEGDDMCPGALRTEHHGRHWDYCFKEDQASSFLTQHGCHCMPEWPIGADDMQTGCTKVEVEGKVLYGCVVLEDTCPGARRMESSLHFFDECSMPAGEEEEYTSKLTVANEDDGCFCQPVWEYQDQLYESCAKTPEATRPWCFILTDDRMCSESLIDGYGTEGYEKGQRWKFCGPAQQPGATASPAVPAPPPPTPGTIRVIPVIIPQDGRILDFPDGSSGEGGESIDDAEGGAGGAHGGPGGGPESGEEGEKSSSRHVVINGLSIALLFLLAAFF